MSSVRNLWSCTVLVLLCSALTVSCAYDRRARVSGTGTAPDTYGFIEVQCKADDYAVLVDGRSGRIELTNRDNPVRVPPGKYTVLASKAESRDAEGAQWRLISQGAAIGSTVRVKAGTTVRVQCGPPLTAKLAARKGAGAVTFGFALRDAAGLAYTAKDITKNGRNISAPGVVVRDESGAVVAQGVFKYG